MKSKPRRGILSALGLGKRRLTDGERLRKEFPFDPARQLPVIRSSVCTGEKVAGFKDLEGGHFTEVLLIRSRQDEERFREIYGLETVKTEY